VEIIFNRRQIRHARSRFNQVLKFLKARVIGMPGNYTMGDEPDY
jgi:hypothetical protein